jgi:hypothetical protein
VSLPIPGRTYDISTFTGTPVGAAGAQAISLLDPAWPQGRGVTGMAKLMQRVLLELLTESGTIAYNTTRGTGFMTALRAGQLNGDAAVFQNFNFAANAILRTLGNDDTAATPADEVLAGMELDSVLFGGDQIALAFTLTSAAGTSAQLLLPVSSTT